MFGQTNSIVRLLKIVVYFWLVKSALTMTIRNRGLDLDELIDYLQVAKSPDHFGLELFQRISLAVEDRDYDFVISPSSVWSLLAVTAEGANGNTLAQLQTVLRLPKNLTNLPLVYEDIQETFLVNPDQIHSYRSQAIFSNLNNRMPAKFQTKLNDAYSVDHHRIDLDDVPDAFNEINDYISNATSGAIKYIVGYSDLAEKQMLMISANHFEGQWKSPFDGRLTTHEIFIDDEMMKRIVSMMHQRHSFPYASIDALGAEVLELPYEDRYSMMILLPWETTTLASVLKQLQSFGMDQIVQHLYATDAPMVDLSLPQFTVTADLTLNIMLQQMGLTDIFNATAADLSKMAEKPTHLSRIIQRTSIVVSERGGVAKQLWRKRSTAKQGTADVVFNVNRPFAFMILEQYTNTLLFCGEIRKPDHA